MRVWIWIGLLALAGPASAGGEAHFGAITAKVPAGKLAKLGVSNGVKVAGRLSGCPAKDFLFDGDIILAVDGKPVSEPGDVDAATRALADRGVVPLTVLRGGNQMALELDLYAGPGCSGAPLGGDRPSAKAFVSPVLDDGSLAPWAAPGTTVSPGSGAALKADQRFDDPCDLGKHLATHVDRPDFQHAIGAVNQLHPEAAATIATCLAGGAPAAAAPAQAAPEAAPEPAAPTADVTAKLKELAELHKAGALTDEEFAAAKAKLLGL